MSATVSFTSRSKSARFITPLWAWVYLTGTTRFTVGAPPLARWISAESSPYPCATSNCNGAPISLAVVLVSATSRRFRQFAGVVEEQRRPGAKLHLALVRMVVGRVAGDAALDGNGRRLA